MRVDVTTAAEGEPAGCLVAFHSQSSIEPGRYFVWLSKANHTYRVRLRAEFFVVHFPGESDLDLARRFGTRSEDDVDKFADVAWSPGPGSVPLIDALPNRLPLRRTTILDDGGDHVCVSGEITDVRCGRAFDPLRLSAASGWDRATRRTSVPSTPARHPDDATGTLGCSKTPRPVSRPKEW